MEVRVRDWSLWTLKMYVCVYVAVYVCLYLCMYACMYVCIVGKLASVGQPCAPIMHWPLHWHGTTYSERSHGPMLGPGPYPLHLQPFLCLLSERFVSKFILRGFVVKLFVAKYSSRSASAADLSVASQLLAWLLAGWQEGVPAKSDISILPAGRDPGLSSS